MKKVTPNDTTITLCMIVKDETHIIEECLESMLPYIDRYDITDTGSTDGTPELIEKFMEENGVPGQVYRSDWKGFGDSPTGIGSRTESLRNCDGKADFAWVIDADDFVADDFQYPPNMKQWDVFSLKIQRGDFTWWRNQIFKTGIGWHYTGILHEYADCDKKPFTQQRVEGNYHIEARTMGARNVGITPTEKYSKDAEMLLDAVTNEESPYYEPDNHRYWFYLAQSYFDSQQVDNAMEAYQKRAELGGWEEEVYYSLFRVAICSVLREDPWEQIQQHFLNAYAFRPIRAEPLHQLSRLYRGMGKNTHAYIFAKQAASIPYPKHDILFISDDVYSWQALDEFVSTAFYAHDFIDGRNAALHLLQSGKVPEAERQRMEQNLKHYQSIIEQNGLESNQTQQNFVPVPPSNPQENMVDRLEQAKEKREMKEQRKNRVKKSTKTNSRNNKYKKRKVN